jgi:hypothetical protein
MFLFFQILKTMPCGNNPLVNQKKNMATPYPQDQEKLDLTLSYHMWQSQCVESNDLDKSRRIYENII